MIQMQEVAENSGRNGAHMSSPECRMAALGLVLRVLDRNKSSYSSAYILAPNGERIGFNQARDMFVSMIGELSGSAKSQRRLADE